jgi:hypothetical protein
VRTIAVAILALTASTSTLGASGPTVRVTTIEGEVVDGSLAADAAPEHVAIVTPEGRRAIRFDGLSLLELRHEPPPAATRLGDAVLLLAGGGRLAGRIIESTEDGFVAETALGERTSIRFGDLTAIRFREPQDDSRPEGLFADAIARRAPGVDVLITSDAFDAAPLRGSLRSLDAAGGAFVFDGRERSFRTEKVYAIVLAPPPGEPPKPGALAELRDGSILPGRLVAVDDAVIRFDASVGGEHAWPIERVARLRIHSPRVTYVSDLSPIRQAVEGRLHRDWPVGIDETVAGKALTLGGRRFERGLGVHSRTELVYRIDGGFERFVAVIGIDDAFRPRGSVVFRIVGDGAVRFDSGPVTGRDEPRHVNGPVGGVRELSLIVDFGADLDLADHAIWGDARLLRPVGGGGIEE